MDIAMDLEATLKQICAAIETHETTNGWVATIRLSDYPDIVCDGSSYEEDAARVQAAVNLVAMLKRQLNRARLLGKALGLPDDERQ